MPTLPVASALFLVLMSALEPTVVRLDDDWNDLPLAERRARAEAALESSDTGTVDLYSDDRRVARFDGDLLVIFADLVQSSVDRELTMETNLPVQVDTPVDVVDMPQPWYPLEARNRGIHGYVQLRCRINADGIVDQIVVPTGEEVDLLTDAAIAAVDDARFTPARRDGTAVAIWKLVPFEFVLDEEPARLAR